MRWLPPPLSSMTAPARLALVLAPLLLAGCAALPARDAAPPSGLFADAGFAAPSTPVGAASLFAVSPAMRAYLRSPAFAAHLRARGLQRGLIDALYSKRDLKLDYEASVTGTAAETYAARSGNCLSLVIMTAAFARELGMTARFQQVIVEDAWTRQGGLYLASSHVNVALGRRMRSAYDPDAERELLVDFLPPPDAARLRVRQLEENDIVALYMNNRAAEALVAGRLDDAYWWARAAVLANPLEATAYNTLGVVYQRSALPALAERAYRAALERAPDSVATLQNLGPLLAQRGRPDEARALAERLARLQPASPYFYFHQGVAAFRRGEFISARDLFRREVERAGYNDEFHYWLGLAHLRLGEDSQAREQLAQAFDTSTRAERRALYAAELAQLRRPGATAAMPVR